MILRIFILALIIIALKTKFIKTKEIILESLKTINNYEFYNPIK